MNLATGSIGQVTTLKNVIVFIAPPEAVSVLRDVFDKLPGELPAAMIILHHVGSERTRPIANNLNINPRLPIMTGLEGVKLQNNRVYVVLSSQKLVLGADARFTAIFRADSGADAVLVDRKNAHPTDPQRSEPLLASLAARYGQGVVGIALTKLELEEFEGFRRIRMAHGHTIALDESDSLRADTTEQCAVPAHGDEHLTASALGKRMLEMLTPATAVA